MLTRLGGGVPSATCVLWKTTTVAQRQRSQGSARPTLADSTPAEPLPTSSTEVSRSPTLLRGEGWVTGLFLCPAKPFNAPYRSFQKGKVFLSVLPDYEEGLRELQDLNWGRGWGWASWFWGAATGSEKCVCVCVTCVHTHVQTDLVSLGTRAWGW